MSPSRHEELSRLLGPAALGLLTSPEQEELDRHLRSCGQCRDELAALTGVAGRLAALDVDEAVAAQPGSGAARSDAVLAAVAGARAAERRRAQRLQAVLGAAASAVVLVAGLVTASALRDGAGADVPLEAVAVEAQEGVRASADLVAHTWGVEIKLVATGLPEGQPYTVQITTTSGEVTGAGAFLGTGDRTLHCNLNASVLRPDAESFTVLDADGRPVLTAEL